MPQPSKTILISGASSGLGRALAEELLSQGQQVIATARKKTALAELEKHPNCQVFALDVTSDPSIKKLVADLKKKNLNVDVLVNNAGYGLYGPLEDLTRKEWHKQFDTNVFGLMELTRAIVPQMRAQGRGRIVNVSSLVGLVSFPWLGAYCASKHAVEAINFALRGELRPFGIKVVGIQPGPVKTNFSKVSRGDGMNILPKNSAYHELYAQALKVMGTGSEQDESKSFPASKAAKIMAQACLNKCPRQNYLITGFARQMKFLHWLLPLRLFGSILFAKFGIAHKKG